MLKFALVLIGLAIILLIEEIFWRFKILKGENQRKLTHVALGAFAATWPWIISWDQIKLVGFLMTLFTCFNYLTGIFHYEGSVNRKSFGGLYYAVAILVCAALVHQKIFFSIAMLEVALADGLAAVVGVRYGTKWRYRILDQTKTIIGSMTFWIVSVCILGIGLSFTNIYPNNYFWLLIGLPPVLTLVEAFSIRGLDNLSVPIVALAALKLFAG